jgi:acetolactate synthase-1/2/3 large subunit
MCGVRVADYIIERLQLAGVGHIFSVSGRGALFLTDAVARAPSVDYIAVHHEQAAGYAAVAYSDYSKNLGACLVSTGCASTNAITAVLSAWQDGIPCVFISGQNTLKETTEFTKLNIRTYGQQEANIIPIVSSITKYSAMVIDPNDIGIHMDLAIDSAMSGRMGPVWLDIPLDIQSAMIDETVIPRKSIVKPEIRDVSSQKNNLTIETIATELVNAKRPVIVIGSGMKSDIAEQLLREILSIFPIPVVYSASAVDVIGSKEDLSIGSIGMLGCSRQGNFVLQNSDYLLVLGNRLSSMTTGTQFDQFAREAKIVVVDIDPEEHKKASISIDTFLNIETSQFLTSLKFYITPTPKSTWVDTCLRWKAIFSGVENYFAGRQQVDLYQLADGLSEVLPIGATLVTDSGLNELILPTNVKFGEGQRCIHPASQGAMGYAIPAAVGSHFAGSPCTVVVVGDGSLMMNIQELETIKYHKLPIKIIVVNNNAYAVIRKRQKELFRNRTIGTDDSNGLSIPNLRKIAECFDFAYMKIENAESLSANLTNLIEMPGPVICEVMGKSDQDYIQITQTRDENRKLVRRPLEDQHPLLDRDFFLSEMIVGTL